MQFPAAAVLVLHREFFGYDPVQRDKGKARARETMRQATSLRDTMQEAWKQRIRAPGRFQRAQRRSFVSGRKGLEGAGCERHAT
jgi:hypothetical protein